METMTTTQQRSIIDIEDKLAIAEAIKKDLTDRMKNTKNKIHIDYLKEKIKWQNMEIRVLTDIHAAFRRTIVQKQKRLREMKRLLGR